MSALSWALRGRHWELAALCLLLGTVTVISELPPNAVEGLFRDRAQRVKKVNGKKD
jgi:hypothetical protein